MFPLSMPENLRRPLCLFWECLKTMGASSVHYFANAAESREPFVPFLTMLKNLGTRASVSLRMSKKFRGPCIFLRIPKNNGNFWCLFLKMLNNLGNPWCLVLRNVQNHGGPKCLSLRMLKNLVERRLVFFWECPRISGTPCASFLRISKNHANS